MNRTTAVEKTRETLDKYGLSEWKVRLTTDANQPFLGMCVYKDKMIILNAFHIDLHGHDEVVCTIYHEVAHALTPGHGHDDVWAAKAREIGCDNTLPCSHLNFPAHVIDAIRSGATVELEIEEETHVIRKPKYKVTRLQEKCPDCGKVAVERFAIDTKDKDGNTVKLITLECFHIIKKIIPKGTPFESIVSNSWKPEVRDCKHEWNKHQCLKCGEFRLLPFQVTGARALESGLSMQKGFGLFDDMGLGKTVQDLAVIKFHPEYTPTLYIVKSALMYQWLKAILTWLGPEYLGQIIKTSKDTIMPGLKSYIISYDLLRRIPDEKLQKIGFKMVVLDECQQIKNPDSARTQEVRKLVNNPEVKVVPLSGTPWKNRGEEFFPVLNMMSPTKFYSHQKYLDTWVEFYWEGNKRKQGGIRNPAKFREFTSDILIRREYNEVMDEFPDINRMKLNVELDELSQSTYDDEVSDFVEWYNEAVIGGEEDALSGIELLGRMARMRHITGLAKIPATVGFVEEFLEDTDRKLVIFVHHKDVGDLLTDEIRKLCADKNIPVFKYHSGLSDEERYNIQTQFNDAPRAFMVASTLACGEGVNLQSCADSVLHERQWNPQNEEQATPGRFRRIGQKSKVINNTIIEARETIDEDIDAIVEGKRLSFHNVMNKSELQTYTESDMAKALAARIIAKHKGKGGKTKITKKASKPTKTPLFTGM